MPQWIALLAIIVVAWMVLAVAGGWLIGRGLGAIERRTGPGEPDADPGTADRHGLRRAG
jgi:hypothetical protein